MSKVSIQVLSLACQFISFPVGSFPYFATADLYGSMPLQVMSGHCPCESLHNPRNSLPCDSAPLLLASVRFIAAAHRFGAVLIQCCSFASRPLPVSSARFHSPPMLVVSTLIFSGAVRCASRPLPILSPRFRGYSIRCVSHSSRSCHGLNCTRVHDSPYPGHSFFSRQAE